MSLPVSAKRLRMICDTTAALQRLSVLHCCALTEVFDSDTDIVSSVQCLFNSYYSLCWFVCACFSLSCFHFIVLNQL